MTYATDVDRQTMRDAPVARCACGHWSAVHVERASVCGAIGAAVTDGFPASSVVAVLLNTAFLLSDEVER